MLFKDILCAKNVYIFNKTEIIDNVRFKYMVVDFIVAKIYSEGKKQDLEGCPEGFFFFLNCSPIYLLLRESHITYKDQIFVSNMPK